MKTLPFPIRLVPLALIVALNSCCTPSSRPLHEKTLTLTVPHVPDSAIHVESKNGSVAVRASDREDVEIIAVLRMQSPQRLEATSIETSRTDANRLTVKVVWPEDGRLKNEGCSFTIAAPEVNGVELKSANGRLEITGLSGTASLKTSNGRIEVRSHQGDVTGHTSNGRITLRDTDGAIDMSSSNGRLEILGATGAVKAHSSNGSVNVDCTESGTGPIDVRTSNGSVTVALGAGFRGELTADNSNGKLSVDDLPEVKTLSSGKHHLHLQFDESEARSTVRTSNGSIEIRRR